MEDPNRAGQIGRKRKTPEELAAEARGETTEEEGERTPAIKHYKALHNCSWCISYIHLSQKTMVQLQVNLQHTEWKLTMPTSRLHSTRVLTDSMSSFLPD